MKPKNDNGGRGKDWAKQRKEIVQRDEWTCQECGRPTGWLRRNTQVHHADGDVTNRDPANLETVCGDCHQEVHNEGLPLLVRILRLWDNE